MRILVHEHASGGGLAGQHVPASLGREGSAMLAALVADLAAIRAHEIVTTVDPRFALSAPPGVEVVTLPASKTHRTKILDVLISSVDAVWLIAPETGRCLERLAARVEKQGRTLVGPGAAAIRQAAGKSSLSGLLARHDVFLPNTLVFGPRDDWRTFKAAAEQIGYPIVVKPARGAGCEGVSLARDARELRHALDVAGRGIGREPLLLQQYVRGAPASVSLLADGRRAIALTVNSQSMRASPTSSSHVTSTRRLADRGVPGLSRDGCSRTFTYRGGTTPFDHALSDRAIEMAVRTCAAIPGLRGYVGVDLVLTRSDAVVIEINPRLTTAYLGVRSVLDENVAALAIDACEGKLPVVPAIRRSVRFTAAGHILRRGPLSPGGASRESLTPLRFVE